jgi:hypothetical protein
VRLISQPKTRNKKTQQNKIDPIPTGDQYEGSFKEDQRHGTGDASAGF